VADVSYWSGNRCDNRGNHVHSIQGGRGMHALGTYALVHTLMSSLRCGGCSAGMSYGGQTRCRGGD